MSTPAERALRSLEGLSVGDGFGQCFFGLGGMLAIQRRLPDPPWRWTDDTEMALSIVEQLLAHGAIDQDELALAFSRRYDHTRGYAGGAMKWCDRVGAGEPWRTVSGELFRGQGSYGNGGAMRAAPIGAYFAGDPQRAADEGRKSGMVTHAHPEGQAGAIAIAVAASLVAAKHPGGRDLLAETAALTPPSVVHDRLLEAMTYGPEESEKAGRQLGTGSDVSAQDTAPWSVYCAAHHLDSYERALWTTAAGLGDVDTTCAIVGGIIAAVAPPPSEWIAAREPLPRIG